jgi:hypothetical protein
MTQMTAPLTQPTRMTGQARVGVPAPLSVRMARAITRASVVGMCISLLLHIGFLLVAGVWQLGGWGGGGTGLTAPVEMAVMTDAELGALIEAELDNPSPGMDSGRHARRAPR